MLPVIICYKHNFYCLNVLRDSKKIAFKWKIVSFVRMSALVIEDHHFICITIKSAFRN